MLLMMFPLFLPIPLWMAWRFFRKEGDALARYRKVLFLTGIVANAVSAAVLLSFNIHAYVASHGTTPVDLDRIYPVLSMLGLGLLSSLLAFSGRGVFRLILVGTGLLTAVLWYFAALAASP
jgi:hypothetical protein